MGFRGISFISPFYRLFEYSDFKLKIFSLNFLFKMFYSKKLKNIGFYKTLSLKNDDVIKNNDVINVFLAIH